MAQTNKIILNYSKNNKRSANVVVDLSIGSHRKIELLLETLICLDEGMECDYCIKLGNRRLKRDELEMLIELHTKKRAVLSNKLPEFSFPQELIDNEAENQDLKDNSNISTGVKYRWFKQNLSLYQAIYQYDRFMYITPDAVIQTPGWLKILEEKSKKGKLPVKGYPLKIKIENQEMIFGWSKIGWYNAKELRSLQIEELFKRRINNPWHPLFYNNKPKTVNQLCLSQKFMSAFDAPLNYALSVLYIQAIKEENDPGKLAFTKQIELFNLKMSENHYGFSDEQSGDENKAKLLLVDKNNAVAAENNLKTHYNRSAEKGSSVVNDTIKRLPLSMPGKEAKVSYQKRQRVEDLHNAFKGERCFIIGNGPSLKKTDLKKLKNEFTIGLNRIYLNYESMGFQTTFLCVTNPNVIQQFSHDIEGLNSIKFLRYQSRDCIKNRWNSFFMEHEGSEGFSKEVGNYIWNEGGTVTYCAMQVAYFLGFKTVILVGVDHHFPDKGKPNKLVTSNADDINHFHPDYFGKGIKWQYPDLKESEKSYRMAKSEFKNNGREILDATVGGYLDIFPKCEFETLFK